MISQSIALSDALVDHVEYFKGFLLSTMDNLREMYKEISDPLERAKIIHEAIDKSVKSELERNATTSVCKKGCPNCCLYMDVMATKDEVKLIKSFLNGKLPKDRNDHCRFLKDDACSIYSIRPGACRKLIATSFPCTHRFVAFPAEIIWSAAITIGGGVLIHKGRKDGK